MNYQAALARRKSRLFMVSSGAIAAALVAGCGGGGGGGNGGGGKANGFLEGVNGQAAIGIADGKASQIGMAVPFELLLQLSPTPFAARARAINSALSVRGLTFLKALNLYYSTAKSGSTFTMSFFSDSAGKTSAGKLTAVSTTSGTTTTYTVNGSVQGNVPVTVTNLVIAFTGTTGANTMKGTITLPKDPITVNLDLSLDSSAQVSSKDSITVTYNYAVGPLQIPVTTTLSALTGGPLTSISGAAAVSSPVFDPNNPSTGTGTGSFTPSTGDFTINITGGTLKGLLESYNGGSDTLTVTPVTGQTINFTDVATQVLASLNTGTGGGTTGTAYAAPVAVKGPGSITVGQALADGEMVGYSLDTSLKSTAYYWSSPTATPINLDPPTGGSQTTAWGISSSNNQLIVVGDYVTASGVQQPCFWVKANGSGFVAHVATSLQYGGEFRAISANGSTIVGDSFDSSGIQHPMAYISGTPYALLGDGRKGNLRATGVDNFNDIVGTGDFGSANPGVWIAAQVDQTSNSIKTALTPVNNLGISDPNLTVGHISPNGILVGGTGSQGDYWDRATGFLPHQLLLGTNSGALPYGVSDDGTQIVGALYTGSSLDIGDWTNLDGAPTDITKQMPSSTFTELAGMFLLGDKSLITLSSNTTTGKTTFLYVKKN